MTAFDLLLRGGTVIDGTGAAGRRADVGVLGDRILVVDDLSGVEVEPAAETIDVDEACELNYTPAEPEDDAAALSSKPSCRSCRDNPNCACRYNGLPRVSCDPCCWGNLGIPQICSS